MVSGRKRARIPPDTPGYPRIPHENSPGYPRIPQVDDNRDNGNDDGDDMHEDDDGDDRRGDDDHDDKHAYGDEYDDHARDGGDDVDADRCDADGGNDGDCGDG